MGPSYGSCSHYCRHLQEVSPTQRTESETEGVSGCLAVERENIGKLHVRGQTSMISVPKGTLYVSARIT